MSKNHKESRSYMVCHVVPPPPIYLTTRPDLGDVSQGEVPSFKNYYELFKGILTPVQMEGVLARCKRYVAEKVWS